MNEIEFSFFCTNYRFYYLQRFYPNKFVKNTENIELGIEYDFYVRPFVPFWSTPQLTFEEINRYDTPTPRKGLTNRMRNILKYILTTWCTDSPYDKKWFDTENVYKILEPHLIARLNSHTLKEESAGKYLSSNTQAVNLKKYLY